MTGVLGGVAHQGADGLVAAQLSPDLLQDQVRGLAAQHGARAAPMGEGCNFRVTAVTSAMLACQDCTVVVRTVAFLVVRRFLGLVCLESVAGRQGRGDCGAAPPVAGVAPAGGPAPVHTGRSHGTRSLSEAVASGPLADLSGHALYLVGQERNPESIFDTEFRRRLV